MGKPRIAHPSDPGPLDPIDDEDIPVGAVVLPDVVLELAPEPDEIVVTERGRTLTDVACGSCNGSIHPERTNVDAFLFGAFTEGDPIVNVVVLIDVRSDAGVLLSKGMRVPVAGSRVAALLGSVLRPLS